MKIIRHTARDMRQALRAVREQLGEDAVILSSRRTGEGVEVTAAVDFDATTLESDGFSPAAAAPSPIIDATPIVAPTAARAAPSPVRPAAALTAPRAAAASSPGRPTTTPNPPRSAAAVNPTVLALTTPRASRKPQVEAVATFQQVDAEATPAPEPVLSYDTLAAMSAAPSYNDGYDADWISEAAREAVMAHAAPTAEPAIDDPDEEVREATLTPLASNEVKATFAEFRAPASATPAATEAMGNELKTLRRMLET